MSLKILPYKIYSESARDLARALGVIRIIPGGRYRPKKRSLFILNWGNSSPHFTHERMLNKGEAVSIAANKLSTFNKLKQRNINTVPYTTLYEEAVRWKTQGHKVVVRQILNGNSGAGLSVCKTHEELIRAPLYTKYVKKDKEYRVHVFNGNVIDVQEKRKKSGVDNNPYVRNLSNGWVFCRDNVFTSEEVENISIRAVEAIGLHFGAVDVIEDYNGRVFILEVNCAPGLQGTTLDKYVQVLERYV